MIMIICEERGELRTLFDNEDSISQHKLAILSFRSRFNADLNYYMVDCDSYIRYGLTADELFDMINEKYIESGKKDLDMLFSTISRI